MVPHPESAHAPQGLRLPKLQEHLDNTVRHRLEFLECSLQGQKLDWMILVHPFQLRVSCDNSFISPQLFVTLLISLLGLSSLLQHAVVMMGAEG